MVAQAAHSLDGDSLVDEEGGRNPFDCLYTVLLCVGNNGKRICNRGMAQAVALTGTFGDPERGEGVSHIW